MSVQQSAASAVLRQPFTLPAPGKVARGTAAPASADALQIAELAAQVKAGGGRVAVVCAQALDAQRLLFELGWFGAGMRIALFSDWETLPYDNLSPHQDLISERLDTLDKLLRSEVDVLLVAASTALQRVAPPSFLAARRFAFKRGAKLDEAGLRARLTQAGYEHVSQVVKPGEYAVRGGLIDLFPMGSALPYRIDLFADEIDTLRTFDPDSQRTLYPVDVIDLLPGREYPFDEPARQAFRNRWRERFEGDPTRALPYRDVGSGIASAGIEYYLPLFHDQTASLFDYLPDQGTRTICVTHGDCEAAIRSFLEDAQGRFRFLGHDSERPLLDPSELFFSADQLFGLANRGGRLALTVTAADSADSRSGASLGATEAPAGTVRPINVSVDRRAAEPLAALRRVLAQPAPSLILAESEGRLETLKDYLSEHGVALEQVDDWAQFVQRYLDSPSPAGGPAAACAIAPVQTGFAFGDRFNLITEAELFTGVVRGVGRRGRTQQTNVDAIIRDLSELRIGDPVVHQQHGIGRYQGLISLDLGDGPTEFLELHYAGDAKLYVPVAQLQLIGRYTGAAPDEAPLHSLGSGQWERARRKAAQQAHDTAAELLNIYARRALRQGHSFKFAGGDYERFCAGFGFEETADQLAAIHATVQDMVSGKPMDRLVCGDVGFGKTEVALRAAFIAVQDGKQVAVLTPTTLLAEQHTQTFRDRFADWPVRIGELSRFRNAKESTALLAGLADGSIDIVIGTHKLLARDTRFARLGLLIIDEEHRFGVRHKEAFKALRAEVDVLTLTATPIPRTLAMSMEGLRDFSVIATAPQRRLAIKTFVRGESATVIREALLRELKRGGQAYFLHNEIDTIENRRLALEQLLPEARIAIAHGQMPERELERVMREFHQQRFNVLLCTTIIETGIDIATANTIIIHRADRFGLAQLHQLRGRVGRSHHQAYAYLLIPGEDAITRDAVKRLDAIQSMEELGSGFFLAMHDLEIRGAGEVLGESQSGNVQEVGFQIYTDMINEAIRALKSGREPDLAAPLGAMTEINLHTPALLPADYCADVNERLTLYKRLANCTDIDALTALSEEMIDRFGKLPAPTRALLETHKLRIASAPLGMSRIDASPEAIVIQFVPQPPIPQERIIKLLQSRKDVRLAGPDRLRFSIATADVANRVARLKDVIKSLSG